ncbi:TIM barrel protein, partial [Salmonella enterica subsp. enterica serovar Typhimurium]
HELDAREYIYLALEYALALEGGQVQIMKGVVPDGADGTRGRASFIDNLRYAADRIAAHDKRILIEAQSPGVKPSYLRARKYQPLGIADEDDRPHVFIQLDTFHAQKAEGHLSHLIREYAARYAPAQIASLPDRHEPVYRNV